MSPARRKQWSAPGQSLIRTRRAPSPALADSIGNVNSVSSQYDTSGFLEGGQRQSGGRLPGHYHSTKRHNGPFSQLDVLRM
jgi:hypothetical protein